MRELNECTAEVFRRGELRIRERRRKRGRVLAVCIPICLIAAVWLAINLPAMMPAGEISDLVQSAGKPVENAPGSPGQSIREPAENAPGSLVRPYTAVEIQAAGIIPERDGKVTDPAAVAELFHAVQSLFAEAGGNGKNAIEDLPEAEGDLINHVDESTGPWRGYTITFTTEDGLQAVYHFNENTLVNVNTNETVFLSDAQADGLLAALGLSE